MKGEHWTVNNEKWTNTTICIEYTVVAWCQSLDNIVLRFFFELFASPFNPVCVPVCLSKEKTHCMHLLSNMISGDFFSFALHKNSILIEMNCVLIVIASDCEPKYVCYSLKIDHMKFLAISLNIIEWIYHFNANACSHNTVKFTCL